jgi:small subunit ribosomal protein S17
MPTTQPQTPVAERAARKSRIGVVTSNKMRKTIVVKVVRLVRHPKYNRVMRQANSFKAHDETNSAGVGDWVKIMETRPLSKDKRWRLVEILRRASTAPPLPDASQEASPDARGPEPTPHA